MRSRFTAEQKLMAIAPMLEQNRPRGGPTLNRLEQSVAAEYKISTQTLRRWRRRYRLGGYSALLEHPRADKGTMAYFTKNPSVARIVGSLAGCHSAMGTWRALCMLRGVAAGVPSYATVWKYMKRLRTGSSSSDAVAEVKAI